MRCSRCKRDLPESAFCPSDPYRCRECRNARKREAYRKKNPARTFLNDKGQWMTRTERWPVILWTGNMITLLKKHFPTTKNRELAELLGVGEKTLKVKAKELGLRKDPEWLRSIKRENGFIGYYGTKK